MAAGGEVMKAVLCDPPAACRPLGFHTTARELQTCTFEGPGASNTTTIPREDPRERKKERKWGRERGKKVQNLGPPTFGPHPSGSQPFVWASTFSGFGPPSLWAPTPLFPPTPERRNAAMYLKQTPSAPIRWTDRGCEGAFVASGMVCVVLVICVVRPWRFW